MLIRPVAVLLCLLFSVLGGCDVNGGSSPKVDMTGTWRFREGPITTSYVLRADGTYTESVSLPSHIPAPENRTGTWFYGDDSMLHLKVAGTTDLEAGNLYAVTVRGDVVSFEGSRPGSVFTRQ